MKIGIDLDNTINDENSKEFFRILCHLLHPEYEIHIITNRDEGSRGDTIKELQELGIQYSQLKLTGNKADYILRNGITVYFDDTDENMISLPEIILVFKIRESGNFDFVEKKWITSRRNSILIDE